MIEDRPNWLSGSILRLSAHSRQPLHRNAYALIASSGVTSVLGLAYWILAAKIYPAEAVGFNAAAISAMMFLAGLAQLNLISALVRFVPEAGRRTRRLILIAYGISIALALIASLIFTAGIRHWTPALVGLTSSPWLVVWFVAATMAWCVFVLEDSAMTGLRQATWVPVSNGIFAVAKVALLVFLAGFAPAYGIFGSWTLALGVALLFTNVLIFGRLVSRHGSSTARASSALSARSIARYVSADYVASLFWLTCTTLLPVIVTSVAGVRENAYFYLAWQIGYSLHILSISTGSSLIVEAVISRDELAEYSRRVFRQNLRITVPAAIVVALIAPYLMQVFGPAYAAEGTTLLRLLALAAVPFSIVSLAISVARVQRRMRRVVAVLAAMCVMVLVLTEVLLRGVGLAGVGAAWLAAQFVLATIVLLTQLRPLWASHAPNGRLRAQGVLDQARRARAFWRHARFRSVFNLVPADLLTQITTIDGQPAPRSWEIKRIVSVTTDIAVVVLGAHRDRSGLAVLKIARTNHGDVSILRSVEVMEQLRGDERVATLRDMIPRVLGHGEIAGHSFTVEELLTGRDSRAAVADPARSLRVMKGAINAIQVLHDRTASQVVVGHELVEKWIDEPARIVRRLADSHRGVARHLAALEKLTLELRGALMGTETTISWVHGDFVPGNVLVAPESDAITGIIDWDQAVAQDLPIVDVVQFLLATRIATSGVELGDLVTGLLGKSTLSADEVGMIERAQFSTGSQRLSLRQTVLLCWLRHLASNLGKSRQYDGHAWWVRRNVEIVLRSIAESTPEATPVASGARILSPTTLDGHRLQTAVDKHGGTAVRPIPILLYHSVSRTPSSAMKSFTVSPDTFAQHLDLIADGHVVLTVAELVSRIDRGEAIPPATVVITFDDGFADNLESAAPLLRARGMTASVFVTTSYIDGVAGGHVPGRMLSWRGVRELDEAGFEIGAHGHGHAPLDVLPIAKVADDVSHGKMLLEQELGHGVTSFAYPHGYRSRKVQGVVRAAGFECACGVRNALSHPLDDRWSLARLTVRVETPAETVAAWLRGESAPIAAYGDAVQTVAWRNLRRLGVASRAAGS